MVDKKNPQLAINGGEPVSKTKIPLYKPTIEEDDIEAVKNAVASTFVSGDGPECRAFEKELAEYLGVKHAFFTTSCTAALDLAFMVKEFPSGSEVIVPNFTFTSTALAPILNNLKVKLIDINPLTGNIDVNKIEEVITNKTVAICPIDYAGYPCDMDAINKIAQKHNLYVVQDSAQSIGAVYKGKKTGTLADVTCFSFHGTKNLVVGEGGAIVTDDDILAKRIIIMREKGTDKHTFITDPLKKGYYEYVDRGNSYVQSNILAAMGRTQLKKLDSLNARRKEIAARYTTAFKNINTFELRPELADIESNWHLFNIQVNPDDKAFLLEALDAEGIGVNIHYSPLHINSYYNHICDFDRNKLNGSIEFFKRLVRIPMYPTLTDEQVDFIINAVKKVFTA
ncbi:MAG TPA: DegT/DnrJ/EryC1/StrS aminotransferase family protein [Ignavibacteriaceae bacterium]|nr:DegT/DnrJ/EryC1/StrS aminotransferase family protein [Ignavibacteriaceae bacterium]